VARSSRDGRAETGSQSSIPWKRGAGNRSLAFWRKSQIFLRNPACSHLCQSPPGEIGRKEADDHAIDKPQSQELPHHWWTVRKNRHVAHWPLFVLLLHRR